MKIKKLTREEKQKIIDEFRSDYINYVKRVARELFFKKNRNEILKFIKDELDNEFGVD